MFVVVRIICGAFGAAGLAGLYGMGVISIGFLPGLYGMGVLSAGSLPGLYGMGVAKRPPPELVVPSRFIIFSAAALRRAATPAPIPRSAFDARRPELSVGRDEIFSRIVGFLPAIYLPFLVGLAVLALSLKSFAVGAPLAPGLRIFSPEPAAMRAFLAWMFAYRSGFHGHFHLFKLALARSPSLALAATAPMRAQNDALRPASAFVFGLGAGAFKLLPVAALYLALPAAVSPAPFDTGSFSPLPTDSDTDFFLSAINCHPSM
jgi:hypothetical protein